MTLQKIPVVYLAGNPSATWQQDVLNARINAIFIDGRNNRQTTPGARSAWNLTGIDHADIVFGYAEPGDPSSTNLAFEFGYAAHAENKIMIYVEEADFEHHRHFEMVRATASVSCVTFEEGLKQLFRVVSQFSWKGVGDSLRESTQAGGMRVNSEAARSHA